MAKLYTPGDLRCSRYEPMIGHTILFRPREGTLDSKDLKPGIITRVYNDQTRDFVDITVFTPTGTYFLTKVPYSEDIEDRGCWFWPKPLEQRALAVKAEPAKPQESATNVVQPAAEPATISGT